MKIEIKVPQAGESVTEAMISQWFKKTGEYVRTDEPLLEFETDKANMELPAERDGVLEISVEAGEVVSVGQVIGFIDTAAESKQKSAEEDAAKPAPEPDDSGEKTAAPAESEPTGESTTPLSPAVRRILAEENLEASEIEGTGKGGRILKKDVIEALDKKHQPRESRAAEDSAPPPAPDRKPEDRSTSGARQRTVPMTMLRRKIAQRLVEAQNQAAILTTFNEVDMSAVMALRATHQDAFVKAYGIKLGIMSFFVKAAVEALKGVPQINAQISGTNIVYFEDIHIGVAVGTDRGLVVPVVRHADRLSFAQIEETIAAYAQQAKDGSINLDDLYGGTFTISNGGIYGNLLSTPILNPPQSGILGLHKIEKRPRVVDDQIVIRPMMYIALSYDHRIVDGKEAVGFLSKVKAGIEDPSRILLEI